LQGKYKKKKKSNKSKDFKKKLICLTNKDFLQSFPMALIVNALEKDQNDAQKDSEQPRLNLKKKKRV
jgi:hypothetical protein